MKWKPVCTERFLWSGSVVGSRWYFLKDVESCERDRRRKKNKNVQQYTVYSSMNSTFPGQSLNQFALIALTISLYDI